MTNYFPKVQSLTDETGNTILANLAFVKSTDVHAYPCGRRNSTIITLNTSTKSDDYYIPFDPEARLNTEYNNTNLSGTNGFTQNFIRDNSDTELKLVLGGYEFKFTNYGSITALFDELTGPKILNSPNYIYANIRLEKVPLYYDGSEVSDSLLYYDTWVLRNQSFDANSNNATGISSVLDHFIKTELSNDNKELTDPSNYYFSGISFSDNPISSFDDSSCTIRVKDTWSMTHSIPTGHPEQIIYSLCLAKKETVDGVSTYAIYQPALLPQIRHGAGEDEIELTNLKVEGYGIIDGDLTVHGNVKANDSDTNAAFYDVDITKDLDVGENANISGNTTIGGNLKADTPDTVANFYDVDIDNNLNVDNTTQTKNLIATDAKIDGEIYRVHGNEAMGLVTMKVINGEGRTDEDGTNHTRKRIAFFTKKATSLPNIEDVTIRDL